MTSLKTSIKTITYLSDTGCLEIQGASLPSKRCNSFICFIAAASSEAGTTSSPAATAVRLPSRYYFFHLSNRLG
ncbi:hypothetical protein MC63_024705 (plasmid) [Shigella flexneri]|nr:hypothetical protein MC63_024705 [Shigella flexneri]